MAAGGTETAAPVTLPQGFQVLLHHRLVSRRPFRSALPPCSSSFSGGGPILRRRQCNGADHQPLGDICICLSRSPTTEWPQAQRKHRALLIRFLAWGGVPGRPTAPAGQLQSTIKDKNICPIITINVDIVTNLYFCLVIINDLYAFFWRPSSRQLWPAL